MYSNARVPVLTLVHMQLQGCDILPRGKLSQFLLNRESFPVEYFTRLGIYYYKKLQPQKFSPSTVLTYTVGLSLLCSKIYLLFLPELPKKLPVILNLFPNYHLLFLYYSFNFTGSIIKCIQKL